MFFVFYSTEDRDLIFQNGPYFMGPQGLYLNKWTLYFVPTQYVPSVVPIWVMLPQLPLHHWNSESLETIANKLGKYIEGRTKRSIFVCKNMRWSRFGDRAAKGDQFNSSWMVSHPGARLHTTSFQVLLLPWLWSFCPKLQEKIRRRSWKREGWSVGSSS